MAGTELAVAIVYDQALAGDQTQKRNQALDGVLEHYEPALYRMALRYSRNPADAEDALQDAYLSAIRHIGEFQGRSQLSTWLIKIVINAARMHLRRHYRHESVSIDESSRDEGLTLAERLIDATQSPEENCQETEFRRIVALLMKRLPKSQRTTFQLREIDGLSTREAANLLGISEGTVKTQLARARHKLGELLAGYADVRRPQRSRERKPKPKSAMRTPRLVTQ
jgi:RNA polymerase sigma-70 factor (ECF subfamily)